MTDLETRVREGLGSDWTPAHSLWEGLMRLYEADREAFYLLACDGLSAGDEVTRPLADLAQRLRAAVRCTYVIEDQGSGGDGVIKPRLGEPLAVPISLIPTVKRFLLEIDGKGLSDKPGKDYEGRPVSEAEVRFKLGEPAEWESDQAWLEARRAAKPVVFRLTEADLRSLANQPGYVAYGLFNCARKTILAPTAVYRGLNRGEKAPERLKQGWAICGKPNRAYDNAGRKIQPPVGMLYMVYADVDGFVFDWDWVFEDPHHRGHPLDNALRFGELIRDPGEFILELPDDVPAVSFDASIATYSRRGDCIFCYITDQLAFAERINPDLTVFRAMGQQEVTGFKIKNVQRILHEEQVFVSDDIPDLTVSVQSILLATLKANKGTSVRIYDVIIEAFRKISHPPDVHFTSEMDEVELVEA